EVLSLQGNTVTGRKSGSAQVIVSAGALTAQCSITVQEPAAAQSPDDVPKTDNSGQNKAQGETSGSTQQG
ncbi:hypothetical protein, partial [Klebsiella pneumoniae]|uniref:hypothetical protein n=1 Tax=Klebsiella pneumoniae TaxID=573 RepID=UPI0025A279D4